MMTNPQDQSWNEAQLGRSRDQARQGQSSQGRSSQNQPQQDDPQFGLASQQQQDHAGISQHGSSDVSGLSPQAGTSANDAPFPTGAGQQQQFDREGGHGPFAGQIQPHAEVVDESGNHIGTVDHVDGDRIKLTRKDSRDGEHHYVLLSQVAGIESGRVRLRERGDNDYGIEADG